MAINKASRNITDGGPKQPEANEMSQKVVGMFGDILNPLLNPFDNDEGHHKGSEIMIEPQMDESLSPEIVIDSNEGPQFRYQQLQTKLLTKDLCFRRSES